MPKQLAFNKFMTENYLVLVKPNDEQIQAIILWLTSKGIGLKETYDGTAIFTKSGRGQPTQALFMELDFSETPPIARAGMAEAYPAPKSLVGCAKLLFGPPEEGSAIPVAAEPSPAQAEPMGRDVVMQDMPRTIAPNVIPAIPVTAEVVPETEEIALDQAQVLTSEPADSEQALLDLLASEDASGATLQGATV